jgi:hypothetical protein
VLDAAQPLLRLHRLDVEQAVALLAALRLRVAEGSHALPLAPDGEDRVERGVDAQPRLLQVVLEAVEDERPVGRVRAQDRGLERQAGAAPDAPGILLAEVGRADVDAWQPLVELVRGRHLARDERVVKLQDAGRDHLRRHAKADARGHAGEQDRRERQHELAVAGASRFRTSRTWASRAERSRSSSCGIVIVLLGLPVVPVDPKPRPRLKSRGDRAARIHRPVSGTAPCALRSPTQAERPTRSSCPAACA